MCKDWAQLAKLHDCSRQSLQPNSRANTCSTAAVPSASALRLLTAVPLATRVAVTCAALLALRYDYDEDASAIVERLHDEYLYNQELGRRLVDSGNWTYSVDLKQVREVRAALAPNKS